MIESPPSTESAARIFFPTAHAEQLLTKGSHGCGKPQCLQHAFVDIRVTTVQQTEKIDAALRGLHRTGFYAPYLGMKRMKTESFVNILEKNLVKHVLAGTSATA